MCSRYPDIKLLAHKDVFGRAMKFCMDIDEDGFSFIPPTFQLPDQKDLARFLAYQERHPKAIYIAKPQVGAQGDSISLFQSLKDLPYSLDGKEIIVQRYLSKPLLLDGIKFDLRIYIMVAGFNPIKAYIYDEGLARFCTAAYEPPTKSNFKKAFMHLTNYSINKANDSYVHPRAEDILVDNEGTKRTLSSLYHTLSQRGVDVEQIKQSINYTCGKVMEVYGPLIEHQVNAMTGQNDVVGKPFQILGLDLLIDQDLKAWVLEVNDHPSLNIYFDSNCSLEHREMTDADICEVDMYVKSRLTKDVIMLAKKNRASLADISQFGSLTQILPDERAFGCAINMSDLVLKLR